MQHLVHSLSHSGLDANLARLTKSQAGLSCSDLLSCVALPKPALSLVFGIHNGLAAGVSGLHNIMLCDTFAYLAQTYNVLEDLDITLHTVLSRF